MEQSEDKNNSTDFEVQSNTINSIPENIPKVYIEYLKRINPKDADQYKLSDEAMYKIVKLMAKLSLGNNFVPSDVRMDELRNEMKILYEDKSQVEAAVKRIELNGIIMEKVDEKGNYFIRFILDPLAEIMAAMWYADKLEKENKIPEFMETTIRNLNADCKGFKIAFWLVVKPSIEAESFFGS